jgi:hypothetical protein
VARHNQWSRAKENRAKRNPVVSELRKAFIMDGILVFYGYLKKL